MEEEIGFEGEQEVEGGQEAEGEDEVEGEEEETQEQCQARVSETARFEGILREMVEAWNGWCAVCKTDGRGEGSSKHLTRECKHDKEGRVRNKIAQTREQFRSDNYAGCRSCGLPQGLCERWRPTTQGFKSVRGGRCQARWVLIDVVTALMETGYWHIWARKGWMLTGRGV